jgi:integrase
MLGQVIGDSLLELRIGRADGVELDNGVTLRLDDPPQQGGLRGRLARQRRPAGLLPDELGARPVAVRLQLNLRVRVAAPVAADLAGIPLFSPHDLRHRRISLLHLRGVPWARIGEFVGQRDISVTADVYSHVLADEAELDYQRMLR